MAEPEQIGYRVVGRIKSVKGECGVGHKEGDELELSGYGSGGLCGFFYHDIFPYLIMLQFGGSLPEGWGDPEVVELGCIDKTNMVTIELRRIRD
jgi:uncharacterized repeat protein (TIGR04076 family)